MSIGNLQKIDNGEYQLDIGSQQRLHGKLVKLSQPLLIIRETSSGLSVLKSQSAQKHVMVTEKILFNSRPLTILPSIGSA